MLRDQALFVAREGGGDVGNHKISGVREGDQLSPTEVQKSDLIFPILTVDRRPAQQQLFWTET